MRLDQRVATRLFVRVSGTARPQLTIQGLTATYHPGAGGLDGHGDGGLHGAQRGQRLVGRPQSVHVSGLFGGSGTAPTVADVPLLLPGASVRERIDVPGVRPGPADGDRDPPPHSPGGLGRSRAAEPDRRPHVVLGSALGWFLLLLLAIGGLILLGRRRRRVAWQRRHRAGRPPATTADELITRRGCPREAALDRRHRPRGALRPDRLDWTDGERGRRRPVHRPAGHQRVGPVRPGRQAGHVGAHDQRPFVWRAVSSTAAPAPYDKAGRTATLFAYQPRPQVDAAEWSGDLLTASARYTDVAHPMAAATALDEPLKDFRLNTPPRSTASCSCGSTWAPRSSRRTPEVRGGQHPGHRRHLAPGRYAGGRQLYVRQGRVAGGDPAATRSTDAHRGRSRDGAGPGCDASAAPAGATPPRVAAGLAADVRHRDRRPRVAPTRRRWSCSSASRSPPRVLSGGGRMRRRAGGD